MPRRERKTLQISKEAFRVLEKATENTNLSYRDLIDSLTGVASSPEKPDTTDLVSYLRQAAAETPLERTDEVIEEAVKAKLESRISESALAALSRLRI